MLIWYRCRERSVSNSWSIHAGVQQAASSFVPTKYSRFIQVESAYDHDLGRARPLAHFLRPSSLLWESHSRYRIAWSFACRRRVEDVQVCILHSPLEFQESFCRGINNTDWLVRWAAASWLKYQCALDRLDSSERHAQFWQYLDLYDAQRGTPVQRRLTKRRLCYFQQRHWWPAKNVRFPIRQRL